MQAKPLITFTLSLLLAALALHFVSYDERKVSLLRMEHGMRQELALKEEIASHCASLSARSDSAEERAFLPWLSPDSGHPAGSACQLTVRSSSRERFHLRSYWNYILQVSGANDGWVLERSFFAGFPTPLCFLPIIALLLALIFELPHWGVGLTAGTYLFLGCGGNAIQSISLSVKSAGLALTTDQSLIGLLLIALWLALHRSRRLSPRLSEPAAHPVRRPEKILGRALTFLIGLWNPAVYTVTGTLFFPTRSRITRLLPFLDVQMCLASLSLYLLTVDFEGIGAFFQESLLLPRYFTFSAILFFAIAYWPAAGSRKNLSWELPHIRRALLFVVAMELLAWRLPFLGGFPKLGRIGFALVMSELVLPNGLTPMKTAREFLRWAGAIFLASFLTVASHQTGIIDLFQVLWEPRVHPTALAIFTFIAGLALGFLTGNFPATFFALFPVILKPHESALVKAALLDGILAGTLTSPFSLFNLIPAAQFGVKLQDLVEFRFRQLALPMLIAAVIFAVGAINSVSILRPVTFVFLCLVACAFRLRKSQWKLGTFPMESLISERGLRQGP